MSLYRKLPVEIEAFKWTGDQDQTEDPLWIVNAIKRGDVYFVNHNSGLVFMKIKTLEGEMTAGQGDYIIKGIKGELYPCKPDIFENSYELLQK